MGERTRPRSQARTNATNVATEKPAAKVRYETLPARWLIVKTSAASAGGTKGGAAHRQVRAALGDEWWMQERPYPSPIRPSPTMPNQAARTVGVRVIVRSQASVPTRNGTVQVRKPSGPPS